mmetsp:Transcript_437/g.1096  ORF Transcript_437/g.1096 Transcript_437/m.1096 type:complete len:229 (+) Transcript_437:1416-2102(+)
MRNTRRQNSDIGPVPREDPCCDRVWRARSPHKCRQHSAVSNAVGIGVVTDEQHPHRHQPLPCRLERVPQRVKRVATRREGTRKPLNLEGARHLRGANEPMGVHALTVCDALLENAHLRRQPGRLRWLIQPHHSPECGRWHCAQRLLIDEPLRAERHRIPAERRLEYCAADGRPCEYTSKLTAERISCQTFRDRIVGTRRLVARGICGGAIRRFHDELTLVAERAKLRQ